LEVQFRVGVLYFVERQRGRVLSVVHGAICFETSV
jgi:hypothetical protein